VDTIKWVNVQTGQEEEEAVEAYFDTVKMVFLDVDQADSTVILFNDTCIIIDAGDVGGEDELITSLKRLGIKKVDALILTHPHADHIAAGDDILLEFEVQDLYMPKVSADTNVFDEVIEAVKLLDMKITAPEVGSRVTYGEIELFFVHPDPDDKYSDTNDYSIATIVSTPFGSALFTGDGEEITEEAILGAGYDISVDVLQVGHHGSKYSSGEEFLAAVDPLLAIISVGLDNSYGHPHNATLKRLREQGVQVFRTDLEGDITVRLNENGVFVR